MVLQRIRDLGVTAAALAGVLVLLSAMDDRVPGHLRQALVDAHNGEWTAPGTALGDMVTSVAASPAANNMVVAAFIAVAVVLVVLMIRT